MRRLRNLTWVIAAMFFALGSGCVELTGQRISWFHDVEKDELHLLLFYDGVHDSGNSRSGKGVEQLPKFVNNGDFMLADWFLHVGMSEIRAHLADPKVNADDKELARILLASKREVLGRYREPNGEVGGAQRIVIPKAKRFIALVNQQITKDILETAVQEPEKDPLERTMRLAKAAAKRGHQWLTLDGHALRLTFPVHPGEWARAKSDHVLQLSSIIEKYSGDDAPKRVEAQAWLQVLASTPFSYLDEGSQVTFILGQPKKPSTLRLKLRAKYDKSLEGVLENAVKVKFDNQLAAALEADDDKRSPSLAAVIEWGPPEEQIRALLSRLADKDPQKGSAAKKRLTDWARQWNRDQCFPTAPEKGSSDEELLQAWKEWYQAMKRYPAGKRVGATR